MTAQRISQSHTRVIEKAFLLTTPRQITVLGKKWEEIQVAPPHRDFDQTSDVWRALSVCGYYFVFSVPQSLIEGQGYLFSVSHGRVYYFRRPLPPE